MIMTISINSTLQKVVEIIQVQINTTYG